MIILEFFKKKKKDKKVILLCRPSRLSPLTLPCSSSPSPPPPPRRFDSHRAKTEMDSSSPRRIIAPRIVILAPAWSLSHLRRSRKRSISSQPFLKSRSLDRNPLTTIMLPLSSRSNRILISNFLCLF